MKPSPGFLYGQGYLAGNTHPVQVPFRRFLHRKRADNVCHVRFLSLNRATTDCSHPHPTPVALDFACF